MDPIPLSPNQSMHSENEELPVSENEISLSENDISLSENDISLSENDISLSENEVYVSENEVTVSETENESIPQESSKTEEGILLLLNVPQITEDAIIQILISPTRELSVHFDTTDSGIRVIEEIRNSITDGNINPALKLFEEHFPKLIEDVKPVPFALYALRYQNLIELVRHKQVKNPQILAEKVKELFPFDEPRFREEVWRLSSLLESEDPSQSPFKHVLDLSRRHHTAAIVLNQIATIAFDGKQEKQVIEKIRSSILSGDTSLAAALMNRHYYELVRDPTQTPKLLFYIAYQHVIELVSCRRMEEARRLAVTFVSCTANRHPWLFDRVQRILALVNCEEPTESPCKDLLDFYHRRHTVRLVLGEIPNVANRDRITSPIIVID